MGQRARYERVPSVKKYLREDVWNPVRRGKQSTFDPGLISKK